MTGISGEGRSWGNLERGCTWLEQVENVVGQPGKRMCMTGTSGEGRGATWKTAVKRRCVCVVSGADFVSTMQTISFSVWSHRSARLSSRWKCGCSRSWQSTTSWSRERISSLHFCCQSSPTSVPPASMPPFSTRLYVENTSATTAIAVVVLARCDSLLYMCGRLEQK